MPQLEIPWAKPTQEATPPKAASKAERAKSPDWFAPPKGRTYLVSTGNMTFRWHEKDDAAALKRASETAKERRSCTTVYEEVPADHETKTKARVGQRLGAFDVNGKQFL